MTLTFIDLLLALALAAFIGLGARRKLAGLVVGLGSLLLFHPLLLVFNGNEYVALSLALIAGLLLGFACRFLPAPQRGLDVPFGVLGGLGGFCLGALLVLVTVTSLPVERNIQNQVVYPGGDLRPAIRSAARRSPLVDVGRDIVLYPLLEAQLEPGSKGLYGALHSFLAIGEPWEGS